MSDTQLSQSMIQSLPDNVVQIVLCYVGNALDLLACERTCKKLYAVLKNDDIWSICQECKPIKKKNEKSAWHDVFVKWQGSYREKAFLARAVDKCHYWQSHTDSVILSVMDEPTWIKFAEGTVENFIVDEAEGRYATSWQLQDTRLHFFSLRGDASAILLEIVECCLLAQLQNAYILTQEKYDPPAVDATKYPSMTIQDIRLPAYMTPGTPLLVPREFLSKLEGRSYLDDLMDPITEGYYEQLSNKEIECINRRRWENRPCPGFWEDNNLGVGPQLRKRIVRYLAYRAGVTKLRSNVYSYMWALLKYLIGSLLKPACIVLANREFPPNGCSLTDSYNLQKIGKLQQDLNVTAGESIRDVPPLPKFMKDSYCPICLTTPLNHTIVPKQVQDAAQSLGIVHRVYGNGWHYKTCRELEVKAAEADYRYVTNSETNPLPPVHTNTHKEWNDGDDGKQYGKEREEMGCYDASGEDADSIWDPNELDNDSGSDMDLQYQEPEQLAAAEELRLDTHQCSHQLVPFPNKMY